MMPETTGTASLSHERRDDFSVHFGKKSATLFANNTNQSL
jgi:hypothetical protein